MNYFRNIDVATYIRIDSIDTPDSDGGEVLVIEGTHIGTGA